MLTNNIKTAPVHRSAYVVLVILLVYCQITSAENFSSLDENDINTIQLNFISDQREQFWPSERPVSPERDRGIKTTSTKDLYTVRTASSSSSDDTDLNTIQFSYISNRREEFWPYEESADSEWDWGIDLNRYYGQTKGTNFTGHHLEGVFGWHYSDKSHIGGTIGIQHLDVPSLDNQKNRMTYDLNALLGVSQNFYLLFNVSDNYVYQLGLQPAAAREFLNAEKWGAGFKWKPNRSIRISGKSSIWSLSDSNTRRENITRLFYELSTRHWIWIGASYENLMYENTKPDYWSPKQYDSVGLVFESSINITNDLSGSLSASLTRVKEDNNPIGKGGSILVGLDYKTTDIHTIRFEFSRILSSQQDSVWTENTYNLLLNGSF